MIKFMVIGLPRSGTTWASNWLTTNDTLCLHDPLNEYHYNELDSLDAGQRTLGVSCTGLYLFPEFLNEHPARKVILHRDVGEIKASLRRNDISLRIFKPNNLMKIEGLHVKWTDLFNRPEKIYNFLLQRKLDVIRHNQLKTYNIQVDFNKTRRNGKLLNELIEDVKSQQL